MEDAVNAVKACSRGTVCWVKGKLDKAVAHFTEAIRLAPTRPEPYLRRAAAYRSLGEEEKAAADERKAQELMK